MMTVILLMAGRLCCVFGPWNAAVYEQFKVDCFR